MVRAVIALITAAIPVLVVCAAARIWTDAEHRTGPVPARRYGTCLRACLGAELPEVLVVGADRAGKQLFHERGLP
jgi:hypothetical protein